MAPVRKVEYVECGRAGRPWGVRGGLLVEWWNGICPVEAGCGFVYVKDGDGFTKLRVIASRPHGKRHIVGIEGVTSRDDALKLRGATFFVPAGKLPSLPVGEYYCYQILGLDVVTTSGDAVGTVTGIFTAGDNDVYEVTRTIDGRKREVLIPAVGHVIVDVDLDAKKMVINPVKGLLE